MVDEINYNGRFIGNIRVVGQTGCGKTMFVQTLGKNNIFGDTKTVDWISKIELSKAREEQIRKTSYYASVGFHYPEDLADFDALLESFKDEKLQDENDDVNSIVMGENRELDRLIVMDNVSGLADKSTEFSSFLTVSRKFGYSCLYIVHIIFLHRSTWQMILAQAKIFNIFPSAIQLGNMSKILPNNCDRETIKYISSRDLWINRLYFEIANKKKYSCLTIDCTKSGPSKYRTEADSNICQTCYYAQNKKDRLFSARNLNEDTKDLTFTIDNVTKPIEKPRHKS